MNCLIIGSGAGLGKALFADLRKTGHYKILDDIASHDFVDIGSAHQVKGYLDILDFSFDHVVITAGVYGPLAKIEDTDSNEWIRAIMTNLIGPANVCREVIPGMKRNNYGKIVLLSGGGATKPMVGASAYAASKAGLVRFAETLAHEVHDYNIDVNCVAPGLMNTKMLESALDAGPEIIGHELFMNSLNHKQYSNKRLEFIDPIQCIKYLLSEEGDGITGKLISAKYDNWDVIPRGLGDMLTLRRVEK
jgi:NAD(P)-dependent dehydrogenase (short-subunit alcohol dehydrogenase family)